MKQMRAKFPGLPSWIRTGHKALGRSKLRRTPLKTMRSLWLMRNIPNAQTCQLKNGAKIVLKAFLQPYEGGRGSPPLRFIAFPHLIEVKRFPELEQLKMTGGFDGTRKLAGGIGHIRAYEPYESWQRDLKEAGVPLKENQIIITDIQMRQPFVKLKPNRTRKRFWNFDDVMLEQFENHLKAGGVRNVIVSQREDLPSTQREKLYEQLLSSHGYRKIPSKSEEGKIYWIKEVG